MDGRVAPVIWRLLTENDRPYVLDFTQDEIVELLDLHRRGYPWADCAEHFGKNRNTVRRYARVFESYGIHAFISQLRQK